MTILGIIHKENLEITSLIGNITTFEDKPVVHTHITCANENSKVIGGHLGEATCSFTARNIYRYYRY
ncbi:PCC domain-containing protein [Anaerococcus cruorum]|uniref:PCC domain-containing protein n=1 Tax=Anaerococcus sp. WGS1596 TaxID=3366806 RepID=UPI00372D1F85